MAIDEKNTDNQIKNDAFVRRMPSHRSQRPVRRAPEAAASKPEEQALTNPLEATGEAVNAEAQNNEALQADSLAAASDIASTASETVVDGVLEDAEAENSEAVSENAAEKAEEGGEAADTPVNADEKPEKNAGETPEKKADEKAENKPKKAKSDIAGKIAAWFKAHKQLTVILATVLLLIIVLIVLFANGSTLSSRKNGNYMDRIRNQEIKVNDVAAIDDFFTAYYTALSSGNTTQLEGMFNDPSKANITTEISTIVSQYDNFKVYVTPGINESDIVAFVSNDIHFDNIDATAPSVDSFYLQYDKESSALKINADMYTDQDILKYMNLVSYREPVRSLLTDTNNRLSEALSGNKDLNNLYILMQSMTESADFNQDTEALETEE